MTSPGEQVWTTTWTEYRLKGTRVRDTKDQDMMARGGTPLEEALRLIWARIQSGEDEWINASFLSRQVTETSTEWAPVGEHAEE